MTAKPVVRRPPRPGAGGPLPDTPGGRASARFDDLSSAGRSLLLSDPSRQFVARRPEQVSDVLRAAERAARDGAWVAGFVTY